jgi:hypothetical protein
MGKFYSFVARQSDIKMFKGAPVTQKKMEVYLACFELQLSRVESCPFAFKRSLNKKLGL